MKAAIILALFTLFFGVSQLGNMAEAGPCQWRGQAPFCNGSCKAGEVVTKKNKQGPSGSKKCATGNKVYCCVEKLCTWRGKAPVCNAKCLKGEMVAAEDKKGDGKKCVTGKKKYCCAE